MRKRCASHTLDLQHGDERRQDFGFGPVHHLLVDL